MTRDEAFLIVADDAKWAALPSRDKDAMVSITIFGGTCARCRKSPANRVVGGVIYCSLKCEQAIGDFALDDFEQGRMRCSEDIGDAFRVIEKLQERGLTTILTCAGSGNRQACCIANVPAAPFAPQDIIQHPTYYDDGINYQSETLPDAICRCAMAWVLTKPKGR